jgi:hypothetical protein
MKSYINEDDILLLLNDIDIKDEELAAINLSNEEIVNVQDKAIKSIVKGSHNKRKTLLAASLALIILIYPISQTTLAKTAVAAVNSVIFTSNKNIEEAVKNDYVQAVSSSSYDNGVKINLTDIVADKTKVALSFELKFDDKKMLDNMEGIRINHQICNEDDKILFGFDETDLSDKSVLKAIDSAQTEFEVINKENGIVGYSIILNSNKAEIPELKKLKIKIKSINYNILGYANKNGKYIIGNWFLNADVSDKFRDYNTIKFVSYDNDKDISIDSAETTPTGTFIRFITNDIIDHNDVFKNLYLIDDKDNKQKVSGSVDREDVEGKFIYTVNFPITVSDKPNALKLLIEGYKGRNVEINLKKK